MKKVKFSLSKQLIIIALISLLLMVGLISLILPKSLEPYFEDTVYSYLTKPLEIMDKNHKFEEDTDNIIYIQNNNGNYTSNKNYKEIIDIDSLDEIKKYILGDHGKFIINNKSYYYAVKGRERVIALTNDSYIKTLRNNMLLVAIPVTIVIFLIILVLLLLWSNNVVNKIEKIKLKIDNFNNTDYSPKKNKKEIDDELMVLDNTIDKMKEMIHSKEQYEREMYQNISHDFKTPIMVVKSYIEAYNDNIEKPDEVIRVTSEEMDKLEKKVKTMLEINKNTYMKRNYKNNEKIKLKKLIEKEYKKYKVINKKIDYKLIVNGNDEFNGNNEIWETIIDNILSNMVRYAKKEIIITINDKEIVFFNDGEKIDDKILNKIFDSYVKDKKGEHGLGLSIVKKNVELLNYKIIAENIKNGVQFIIER